MLVLFCLILFLLCFALSKVSIYLPGYFISFHFNLVWKWKRRNRIFIEIDIHTFFTDTDYYDTRWNLFNFFWNAQTHTHTHSHAHTKKNNNHNQALIKHSHKIENSFILWKDMRTSISIQLQIAFNSFQFVFLFFFAFFFRSQTL